MLNGGALVEFSSKIVDRDFECLYNRDCDNAGYTRDCARYQIIKTAPWLCGMAPDSPHNTNQQPTRVRMIDIARAAGVSRAAVSCAINGGKMGSVRLSDETAARIRSIAEELRFHPNHTAQQLAGKRSGIIGTLAKTWFWQTESRALGWLNQLSSDRGFKILAWQMEAYPDALDRFVDECLSWNIDGLVFVAYKYDDIWPAVAKALTRLPRVVSILGNPGIPGGYTVEVDAADGVWQSVEHCFRTGRRRVVQVLEGREAQIDGYRYEAFQAAHRKFYGVPDDDQVCFATAGWVVADYEKYADLARELVVDRRADAVLADSDFSTPGLVSAWHRLGLSIPDDIALIGWGHEMIGRGVNPRLTTVDFNFGEVVGKALELLSDLIERPHEKFGGDERPRSILVKPKLIVQDSA
jgi:DNA-binding LacI/PurR family transcriptional regulator